MQAKGGCGGSEAPCTLKGGAGEPGGSTMDICLAYLEVCFEANHKVDMKGMSTLKFEGHNSDCEHITTTGSGTRVVRRNLLVLLGRGGLRRAGISRAGLRALLQR